ncbi:MAG: methyl-accepting chemotaxis protein [Thalassolituus maritimus]|nr:MAG: methyl-accepting chemotaxis protein [Thalassolituus maritimus]
MQGERLSIRQRLWIMLSAVFLMGVIYIAVDFHQYQNQLVEEKKQQLSALVESQASLLSQLLSNGGDLQEGLSAINGSRYHGEEYFFVINEQLIMKMHPFKPVLNETSVSKVRDPDGVYLFREMKKAVEKGGTGFVYYKWPRPGAGEPVSKLSAITPVAGSDLYIGTGEYIDDIQAAILSRGGWTLFSLLIWGAFILVCSRYIAAAISKPIRRIEETMATLAEGDLSFECELSGVPEFDRISVAINKMRSRLSELLSRIRDDSDRLNREADIVSRSTSEVSAGSDSQYRELDQLSVAMTEMVQTTQVLAGNARDAAQRMTEVTDAASNGANSVSAVRKRVYTVLSQLEGASVAITQMNASAEQISNVAEVIASISEQTNLLALNAAIEAARAGESGRGFAVVADEVRTLAQRTGVATSEIKDVIETITQVANDSVRAMQLSAEETKACADEVNTTEEQLAGISTNMTLVKDINHQVAASVTQQEQVAAEMDSNLSRVAESADGHKNVSDLLRRTSKNVERLAEDLVEQLKYFRTDLN